MEVEVENVCGVVTLLVNHRGSLYLGWEGVRASMREPCTSAGWVPGRSRTTWGWRRVNYIISLCPEVQMIHFYRLFH
jgi:hypothetical protein